MRLPYKIGIFSLGNINVDVYLERGHGGAWLSRPSNTARPKLLIGVDQAWWRIITVAMHEAEEFCYNQFGYSFVPTAIDIHDSTTYVFHFDHGGLCKVNEAVGYFWSQIEVTLKQLHKQYQKEQRHVR